MSTVPDRYRGVWVRKLLDTPQQRDQTTFVRWLQTGVWHADVRIPVDRPGVEVQTQRAAQQGFCGVTQVAQQAQGDVCTWHRRFDFQPPRTDVDAGVMVFETPERVIETGVHAPYLEIWERLPGSTGRFIALARLDEAGNDTRERFLVAGRYAMHVRPRHIDWPRDTQDGQTLSGVLARYPAMARELLDFEISFGTLDGEQWVIERSTLPAMQGVSQAFAVRQLDQTQAAIDSPTCHGHWQILEWSTTAKHP
jgi:hypothetical protein